MQALLRSKEQEIYSLRYRLKDAEEKKKRDEAWWSSQVKEKDRKLQVLRKALSEMESTQKASRVDEETWKREREDLEEKMKKSFDWASTVFNDKTKEVSLLRQSIEEERQRTKQALQDKEELEKELKDNKNTIESLNMEIEKMSSSIAALQAQSASQQEEFKRMLKQAEDRATETCEDNNKVFAQLTESIDRFRDQKKHWAEQKLQLEAQMAEERESWKEEREKLQEKLKQTEETCTAQLAEISSLCQNVESAAKERAEMAATIAALSSQSLAAASSETEAEQQIAAESAEADSSSQSEDRAAVSKKRKGWRRVFSLNIFRRKKRSAEKELSEDN